MRADHRHSHVEDRFRLLGRIGSSSFVVVDTPCPDKAPAMQDAAKFARRLRHRLGFSQAEFATRIDVSLETIRNGEQGKRSPTSAAKA